MLRRSLPVGGVRELVRRLNSAGSGAVGFVKPEPEIYQIMLEKIGRPAPECLLIDDSLSNIQQANKIGFATIHFESPPQLEKELKQLGLI